MSQSVNDVIFDIALFQESAAGPEQQTEFYKIFGQSTKSSKWWRQQLSFVIYSLVIAFIPAAYNLRMYSSWQYFPVKSSTNNRKSRFSFQPWTASFHVSLFFFFFLSSILSLFDFPNESYQLISVSGAESTSDHRVGKSVRGNPSSAVVRQVGSKCFDFKI